MPVEPASPSWNAMRSKEHADGVIKVQAGRGRSRPLRTRSRRCILQDMEGPGLVLGRFPVLLIPLKGRGSDRPDPAPYLT